MPPGTAPPARVDTVVEEAGTDVVGAEVLADGARELVEAHEAPARVRQTSAGPAAQWLIRRQRRLGANRPLDNTPAPQAPPSCAFIAAGHLGQLYSALRRFPPTVWSTMVPSSPASLLPEREEPASLGQPADP